MSLFGKRPSHCFVKLLVDKDIQKTALAARGNTAWWNKPFSFYHLNRSSVLEIEVYGHRPFARDDYIGGAKEQIELLLAEGGTGAAIVRKLQKSDKAGDMHKGLTVLEFTLTSFAKLDEAREAQLNEAVSGTKAVDEIVPPAPLIVDAGLGLVPDGRECWGRGVVASGLHVPAISAHKPLASSFTVLVTDIYGITDHGR
ncbi:hypothetical protein JB92DRAFT_2276660 [Gautieria morchelliformis]|nr:hypothetical protein JB92DRAFT_2276660 [Gautieria morchelliformis]